MTTELYNEYGDMWSYHAKCKEHENCWIIHSGQYHYNTQFIEAKIKSHEKYYRLWGIKWGFEEAMLRLAEEIEHETREMDEIYEYNRGIEIDREAPLLREKILEEIERQQSE